MAASRWLSGWEGPLRVVCFQHAGAAPGQYRNLLRDRVDGVAEVRVPGRPPTDGTVTHMNVAGVASAVADEVVAADVDRVVLWGHSIGAVLAFQTCQVLEQERRVRPLLVVSGRDLGQRTEVPEDRDGLVSLLVGHGGTPAQVFTDPDLLDLAVSWLRFDLALAQTAPVRGTGTLESPLVCVYGAQDPATTSRGADAWRHATHGTARVERVPGGHFFPWTGDTFVNLLGELADGHVEHGTGVAGHGDGDRRL